MRYVLMIIALCLSFASVASAVEMQRGISLQPPTQYTDGSTIGPGELANMNLWCGEASGAYVQDMSLLPDTTFIPKEDLLAHFSLRFNRIYYCAATATTANGLSSGYSIEVNFTVPDQRSPESPLISVQ